MQDSEVIKKVLEFNEKEVEMLVDSIKFSLDPKNVKVKNYKVPWNEYISSDDWLKSFHTRPGWQVDARFKAEITEVITTMFHNNMVAVMNKFDNLIIKFTERIDLQNEIIKRKDEEIIELRARVEELQNPITEEEEKVEEPHVEPEIIEKKKETVIDIINAAAKRMEKSKKERELNEEEEN